MHSLSVATVGTKGQIVIPQEIRDELKIEPGDRILVLTRGQCMAAIVPMSKAQKLLEKMSAEFDELKNLVDLEK